MENLRQEINEAVLECGAVLSMHFPIKDDDENELDDGLRIVE